MMAFQIVTIQFSVFCYSADMFAPRHLSFSSSNHVLILFLLGRFLPPPNSFSQRVVRRTSPHFSVIFTGTCGTFSRAPSWSSVYASLRSAVSSSRRHAWRRRIWLRAVVERPKGRSPSLPFLVIFTLLVSNSFITIVCILRNQRMISVT